MRISIPDKKLDWMLQNLQKDGKDTDIDKDGWEIKEQAGPSMQKSTNDFKDRDKLNKKIQDAIGTVTGAASLDTVLNKTIPRILKEDGSFDNFEQYTEENSVTWPYLHTRMYDDNIDCNSEDAFQTCYHKGLLLKQRLKNRIKFMGDFALSHTFIKPDSPSNRGHQKAVNVSAWSFMDTMTKLRRRRQQLSRQQRGCVYQNLKKLKIGPNVQINEKFIKSAAEKALSECKITRTSRGDYKEKYHKGPEIEGFYKPHLTDSSWSPRSVNTEDGWGEVRGGTWNNS